MTLAITVIGLVASLVALYEFFEQRRRRDILRWREANKLLLDMLEKLERDKFNPGLILGVGRGGSIIAAMVATNLEGRIPLACVDTELSYDPGGKKLVVVRHAESAMDLQDYEVLIVVAELYSGQDLVAAIDFVESRGVASFRTMALLSGPTTVVKPDFCGQHTKHEPMAPWRITEAGKKGRI